MFLAEVAHVVDCPQGQRIHRVRSGLDLGVHKQRLTTLHVVTRLTKNVGLFVHRIGVTVLDGSRVVRASANRNDDLLNRPHLAGQLGHEVLVHSVDNQSLVLFAFRLQHLLGRKLPEVVWRAGQQNLIPDGQRNVLGFVAHVLRRDERSVLAEDQRREEGPVRLQRQHAVPFHGISCDEVCSPDEHQQHGGQHCSVHFAHFSS
uniref:(northern house mosquito) hypothetical protein n=2 Tax=Culex pipiens TaxID=7175 RepID=A0A8D8CZ08_CULPI